MPYKEHQLRWIPESPDSGSGTSTHRMKPSWYSTSSFSPTGTEMSNTASVQAMLRNKVRRAKCLPGQILRSSIGFRECVSRHQCQAHTFYPTQIHSLLDSPWNNRASHPSGTAPGRMYRVWERRFRCNTPTCSRNKSTILTSRHQNNTHQTFSIMVEPAGM